MVYLWVTYGLLTGYFYFARYYLVDDYLLTLTEERDAVMQYFKIIINRSQFKRYCFCYFFLFFYRWYGDFHIVQCSQRQGWLCGLLIQSNKASPVFSCHHIPHKHLIYHFGVVKSKL